MGNDLKYLIYGRRVIEEFLLSDYDYEAIETIFLSESIPEDFTKIFEEGENELHKKFRYLKRRELDQRFPEINHQGVVILFRKQRDPHQKHISVKDLIKKGQGPLLLLDEIQDPQNTGSIIRSAEALGIKAIFLCGQGAKLTPAVDRVSAGATFHIPVITLPHSLRLVQEAQKNSYWIVASSGETSESLSKRHPEFSKKPIFLDIRQSSQLPSPEETLLVIGNEENGVCFSVLNSADYLMRIPLHGKIQSLNAGVAAGILMDRVIHRALP